jgi:hypothetical protein
VNDKQRWEQATRAVRDSYGRIPPAARAELDEQIERITQLKQDLVRRTHEAGSADVCRQCGGVCCLNGKYHVTVLDLLAYLGRMTEPPTPDFEAGQACPYSGAGGCSMPPRSLDFEAGPACPYSGAGGCSMPPRFRPMTCVVFNCELVEGRMGPDELTALYDAEGRLREAIALASRIACQRLDRALLLTCDA